jgi:hypothetical protein
MIQYSEVHDIDGDATEYWMPAFAGMTAHDVLHLTAIPCWTRARFRDHSAATKPD